MMKLAFALPLLASAEFNYTKCPALHEVQTARVLKEWDWNDYLAYYYELAFHDSLQAACPAVSCVNSNKTLRTWSDGVQYVNEDWGLTCLGKSYPQVLLNNVTEQAGFFKAFVPQAKPPFDFFNKWSKNVLFPNMVVDRKPGPKGWTLEFQCVDAMVGPIHHVPYIGINFYAKDTSEETYQEMLAAAKASGIDFYMNYGNPSINYRRVDHSKCGDEPAPPQEQVMV